MIHYIDFLPPTALAYGNSMCTSDRVLSPSEKKPWAVGFEHKR
jgi:hypothetical protein